ncbi:MAG: cyclic nucleotide-binding domain-containing protein [Pseudorhodoplanes sp.]|nr:cyclic nucleotide-binding domain-containing protein [Pseudorhodoplanes sp.]
MSEEAIDFSLLLKLGATEVTYKAGDTIFAVGDEADELYIIEQGEVDIRLGNRLLATLDGNAIFGEMALIDDKPRSATAVARTDVKLVPVSEKQFLFLVSHTPFFALRVMRVLAGRLRTSNMSI